MSQFYAGMLLFVLNHVLSRDFMDKVIELVSTFANFNMTGEEKRAAVLKDLGDITGELKKIYDESASWLINLALEAAVAWVKRIAPDVQSDI